MRWILQGALFENERKITMTEEPKNWDINPIAERINGILWKYLDTRDYEISARHAIELELSNYVSDLLSQKETEVRAEQAKEFGRQDCAELLKKEKREEIRKEIKTNFNALAIKARYERR